MNLFILATAAAVAATGAGRFSLDNWIGWAGDLSGLWWGVGVRAAALATSIVTGRRRAAEPAISLRRAA